MLVWSWLVLWRLLISSCLPYPLQLLPNARRHWKLVHLDHWPHPLLFPVILSHFDPQCMSLLLHYWPDGERNRQCQQMSHACSGWGQLDTWKRGQLVQARFHTEEGRERGLHLPQSEFSPSFPEIMSWLLPQHVKWDIQHNNKVQPNYRLNVCIVAESEDSCMFRISIISTKP